MSTEPDEQLEPLQITAYSAWGFDVKIVPAWFKRDWMDATSSGFAYQCLPMTLANQSGWFILAPHGATAEWNGGKAPTDLKVHVEGSPPMTHAMSQVGSGILTWTIPYIFRTPPGWNLLCRGPANHVKDGISPLEGLVETDWSLASFSMNWKMTRPGSVTFEAGEPVAMLVPHFREDLEDFQADLQELSNNPELSEGYRVWITSRQEFLAAQRSGDLAAIKKKYQKHYFQGTTNSGVFFEGHQKKRRLAHFDASKISRPPEPEPGVS
ncbi:DUF6065 family protein [Singulisphaera sp. PoT]|uniref:DUF6065 family protein n=1 Tax=Singulisphaera sp. PoT TaxID=3411797 RepID=UPI003BF4C5A3